MNRLSIVLKDINRQFRRLDFWTSMIMVLLYPYAVIWRYIMEPRNWEKHKKHMQALLDRDRRKREMEDAKKVSIQVN